MKLIFLDIDGTFTLPGATEPPESAAAAVRAARAAGNMVFLCTGRNYAMLAPILSCGFDGYIGCAGGYVVSGDRVLFDCPMTEEQRDRVMTLLHRHGIIRTLEAKDASFCDEGAAELIGRVSGGNSELVRWRRALEENLHIRPMREYDGSPAYKVLFLCEREEQLAPAKAELDAEFRFVVQDAFSKSCVNGELINRRFDKGRGVRLVAEDLGVPLSDTVGFGDSLNDLEMVETVGLSICMGDGSEALRRRADRVCGAVAEDGLARAFEELGLV